MPTFVYSYPVKYWRPLCTNSVRPETSVNAEQCLACVIPVAVPPSCGGTARWVVRGTIGAYYWLLDSNNCTGSGEPIQPPALPPGFVVLEGGLYNITDCCTGAVIESGPETEPF